MGAGNVKAVYALYRSKVNDQSFTVLSYMAVVSLDKDTPPVYFAGWQDLAYAALGRPPAGPDEDEAPHQQAVKRAIRTLTKAGAISLCNAPRTGERAVYALHLDVTSGVRDTTPRTRGQGVTTRTAQGVTTRTPPGGHLVNGEGVTTRPPKEEVLQEPPQDLPQESNSATPTTVTPDARAATRAAVARRAAS